LEVSDLMELVRGEDVRVSGGGRLRTYLGIAPGVGKTVAMLAEGRRRAATASG
jgi:K+-sensing histidine kinase KdpD